MPSAARKGPLFYSRAYFTLAVKDAGLNPREQDVLRHGYRTCRLKITGSFGAVADEAGSSEKIIRARYYHSLSRTAADECFAILPPALPEGYVHLTEFSRWNRGPALAARVLP